MGAAQDRRNQASVWDFFDRIYCITLASRADRMEEARAQFAAVGLEQRVEFLVVAKDQEDPVRGIFLSHQRCLARALEAGGQHILVFEDDILFRRFKAKQLAAACDFLGQSADWQAFFLGCLTSGSRPTPSAAVDQVRYRCLSHAYAVSRAFASRLVREPWCGLPYDGLLRHHRSRHFFALRPMCAFQGASASDNQTVWIDRLRTVCGGLALVQRGNEFFFHHQRLIIALHLLVAAAALALFLLVR